MFDWRRKDAAGRTIHLLATACNRAGGGINARACVREFISRAIELEVVLMRAHASVVSADMHALNTNQLPATRMFQSNQATEPSLNWLMH
jgi:hypothetical protein